MSEQEPIALFDKELYQKILRESHTRTDLEYALIANNATQENLHNFKYFDGFVRTNLSCML